MQHGVDDAEIEARDRTLVRPSPGLLPIARSTRIVDAVLMGLLVYRLPLPFLPVSVPVAQTALVLLLAICLFRRPVRRFGPLVWYPLICLGILALLVSVSAVDQLDVVRRGLNILILMLTAGFLASGRIDAGSALKGLGAALVLNAGLFAAGVAPDAYQGALTGYLQDKNVAGLFYAVVALLVSATMTRPWARIAVLAAGGAAVLATDSRTSMAAFAGGVLWLALSPRLGPVFRTAVGAGIVGLFLWAEQNLSTLGVYGIERAGSDALRERIQQASLDKVSITPWTGGGLGSATADVDGITWFFHNSYLALLAEGGAVLLIAIVAIYVVAGLGPSLLPSATPAAHAVGAAAATVLLCATQLGEVFFSPVSFVVVGAGLALLAQRVESSRTGV